MISGKGRRGKRHVQQQTGFFTGTTIKASNVTGIPCGNGRAQPTRNVREFWLSELAAADLPKLFQPDAST